MLHDSLFSLLYILRLNITMTFLFVLLCFGGPSDPNEPMVMKNWKQSQFIIIIFESRRQMNDYLLQLLP